VITTYQIAILDIAQGQRRAAVRTKILDSSDPSFMASIKDDAFAADHSA